MKNILNFLINIGKLKGVKRRGLTFYGVKEPDSTTDHMFRMALMAWFFGKNKKFNMEKIIKTVLIHDICKVLTGDITPYDGLLPTNKKKREKFVNRWLFLPLKVKEKKYRLKFKKEYNALRKLTLKLPAKLKKEIKKIWLDYHESKSPEAKFVSQIDIAENLLEAFEWRKKNKEFPTLPWWEHAEEVIDDQSLLDFLKEIEKEELKRSR